MLCFEWGGLEILAILASFISLEAISAQVLALNTFIVLMMVPFGGQMGTIACVGRAMGEGKSKEARIYIKMAVVIILVADFGMALLLIIWKDLIAQAFTTNA